MPDHRRKSVWPTAIELRSVGSCKDASSRVVRLVSLHTDWFKGVVNFSHSSGIRRPRSGFVHRRPTPSRAVRALKTVEDDGMVCCQVAAKCLSDTNRGGLRIAPETASYLLFYTCSRGGFEPATSGL